MSVESRQTQAASETLHGVVDARDTEPAGGIGGLRSQKNNTTPTAA